MNYIATCNSPVVDSNQITYRVVQFKSNQIRPGVVVLKCDQMPLIVVLVLILSNYIQRRFIFNATR